MPRPAPWTTAKLLQGAGLVVVLAGVFYSISYGIQDQGLGSMKAETYGLALGGALFLLGWIVERSAGRR